MYIFKDNDTISWDECTATIGFFDGVHIGHQYLLQELQNIARDKQQNSLVITFDEHPSRILKKATQPKLITTLDEKVDKIGQTGVDACFILAFTQSLSQLSAFEFIKTILVKKLNVKNLLIGYDHRFGQGRKAGFEAYQSYAKTLHINVIQATQFIDHKAGCTVNSSNIREYIQKGAITEANRLLGTMFSFGGKVVGGFKMGRKVGFPTANLQVDEHNKIIPATGVYAVKVHIKNKKQTYKGMMNIGYRPTFSQSNIKSIEVHIIDFAEDIYTQEIVIEVAKKIRDEMKFGTISSLIEQLEKDKQIITNSNY